MSFQYSSNKYPMKQTGSKNVGYRVEMLKWSEKMDLLIIASDKGEAILYRLKWQKVWQLAPPEEGLRIRGLSFRPLEKVMAIAYSNGAVLLINIENKEEIHNFSVKSDIRCMNWTDNTTEISVNGTSGDAINNHTTFLPPLPGLNSLSSTTKSSEYNALKFYSKQILNLLIIGTTSGIINLSVFGMLPCCEMNLFRMLGLRSDDATIKDAKMSTNFLQMFVTIEREGLLELIIFENDTLKRFSTSLLNLAIKHAHILGTMAYIGDAIECIIEAWETVLLEMDNKLTKYANSQPQGSISADFLELLMFGCTSPALEQFLLRDLTEKGLKKLGNSIELSYSTIQKLVVKPLHTAICSVFFHLNSLQGMIRNEYYYKPLLGDVSNEALINCGSFLIKAYELQQTIDTSTRDFKIFFRWLYIVIVRLMDESLPEDNPSVTQQEINYLAEFLDNFDANQEQNEDADSVVGEPRRKFNLERVGQYLEDKPLNYPSKVDATNQWAKLLEQNECLKSCSLIFPHNIDSSLVQQFNQLKACIDKIFKIPITFIGKDFKQKSILTLRNQEVSEAFQRAVTHINMQENDSSLFALLESDNSLVITECNKSSEVRSVRLHFGEKPYFKPKLSSIGELKFRHVQFYSEALLSALLRAQTDEGHSQSFFLQVELKKIRQQLEAIPFVNAQTVTTSSISSGCRLINAYTLIDEGHLRPLEGMEAGLIAVSGPRNLISVVSESLKSIRIYDMDAHEDEDDLLDGLPHQSSFDSSRDAMQLSQ
ncbi:anaphase-promoting complex subunit 4 [Toxorhynchites rutilus septentrionalis]|uniref:anaphase-promoting complex subunit 4 n=1 Tax=Toxorhynchites rutilus septentrionalis TaxID=329112 RepID=UPI00247957EB|nr:anaphase-promoting complex subunit 4 [Toxorhynchites rutilus septentrionalis]